MDFIGLMKNENDSRKTLTENGAVAYATTGKELLDFNFKLSGFRTIDIDNIKREFGKVFFEDPLTSVKYLFWVGDIREGAGERKAFRSGLLWLAENKPKIMKRLIPLVGEYNRFDSLLPLLDTKIRETVSSYLQYQIEEDVANMSIDLPISLAGKWAPSNNTSSAKTRHYANILIEDFGWSPKKYRKVLASLRKYLDVVEVKMSANEWNKINYETVPSKANLIYADAFLRNDTERRREYLASLEKGDAKINAGVLQPHEIVSKYMYGILWESVRDYDETLEQLWSNLPNETITNTLVVRDGSASMSSKISGNTSCLDVATALTVYMAERNSGEWKNKFLTFSHDPRIIDISHCETLHDKLEYIYEYNECSNTDIHKTMMIILETAVNNHLSQDEMPETIVICSDLQFDGNMFNLDRTLFEEIIEEFKINGYNMPKLCFWNINDRGSCSVPLKQNDYGLVLCSGFSVQILQMMMSCKLDPYEVLIETINSERYKIIEETISSII